MTNKWGTKEWFEYMFGTSEEEPDRWGHQWRGSQKFRYDFYIKILKNTLPTKGIINILDIGCGLGDFTKRIWELDPKNEIFGMDISENAIVRFSKKYPNMKLGVASLPTLPFNENSFDLILCLEVLYYLNSDDRIESLKNIKKTLRPDGYLLLSGVLDGGMQYFTQVEIENAVGNFFEIEEVEYNYARIYTTIEGKLLSLSNICSRVESIFVSSDKEFIKRCEGRMNERRVEKIKMIRKIINRNPFSSNIVKAMNKFMSKMIICILSWKFPVKICYIITKFVSHDNGKTQIIILARNNKKDGCS